MCNYIGDSLRCLLPSDQQTYLLLFSPTGNLEWTLALEWTGKADYNLAAPLDFISGKEGKSAGKTRSTGAGSGTLTYLQVYDAGYVMLSPFFSVGIGANNDLIDIWFLLLVVLFFFLS